MEGYAKAIQSNSLKKINYKGNLVTIFHKEIWG
jgi:hypothetical protein